jgi:hypothetical protein
MAIPSRLRRRATRVGSGCALLFAVLGLAACGHSASRNNAQTAAIRVGTDTFSKPEVAHWTQVEAVISREVIPRGPVPAGVVPDPPKFTACIALLRSEQEKEGRPDTSSAQLRAACASHERSLKQHTLDILTTVLWLKHEAKKQGIDITSAEREKFLAKVIQEKFHGQLGFKHYVEWTHESRSDELMILEANMITTQLVAKIGKRYGAIVSRAFFDQFSRRWARQTTCAHGYIVSNCREYRGSEPPEPAV